MRNTIAAVLGTVLFIGTAIHAVAADSREEVAGVLCGRSRDPQTDESFALFLPLKKTDVEMDVTAGQISTRVTQTFENNTPYPLEAAYIFPLPSRATITDMRLQIGERIIRSVVQERAQAKKTYEAAKAAGKKTALLEQERPNIFTTSVANFLPGETVSVSFTYMESLTYDHGSYEINFPMVVGQRYIPWEIVKNDKSQATITTPVADPERLNPPVLHPNIDPEHRLSISVELSGFPIESIESTTHAIAVDPADADTTRITLRDRATIPDSDFNLKVELAQTATPQISFVESSGGDGSYGLLTVFPPDPQKANASPRPPREVIFLIDTSGSMSGASIGQAQAGLKECVRMLQPEDTFTIVRFASEFSSFSPDLRPATPAKLSAAHGYIEALAADGGTEMQPALEYCLDMPRKPGTMRMVVLLTDGCVGNEDSLMRLLTQKLGQTRLFTFAIGSAPNEFLTRRMAEIGRGQFRFIHSHEEIGSVMSEFFKTLAAPVFTDLNVAWLDRDGEEREVVHYPDPCSDIFFERPLQLVAKTGSGFAGSVTVTGKFGGETITFSHDIGEPGESVHTAIDKLYGRSLIDALMYERIKVKSGPERDLLRQQIVDVALEHQLVSAFTSRVAVEKRLEREPDGQLRSVKVPTPLPKGWNPAQFGATASQDVLLFCVGLISFALYAILALIRHRPSAAKSQPKFDACDESNFSPQRALRTQRWNIEE